MGITHSSIARINPYLPGVKTMLELGAQNIYAADYYGMIAKEYFEKAGIEHTSIDIVPYQGAIECDLRELHDYGTFDIVTNYGTTEHIDGSLFTPFVNIHNACKIGGIIIHENPKTGNWPGHGHHYFTEDFYTALSAACGYDVLEVTSEHAMGNDIDGWNVCAVLKKTDDKFISEAKFNKIYAKFVFTK